MRPVRRQLLYRTDTAPRGRIVWLIAAELG